MPTGPSGEKRPKNPNAAAVMVGKIATGRMEEQYVEGASKPVTERQTETKTPTDTNPKA